MTRLLLCDNSRITLRFEACSWRGSDERISNGMRDHSTAPRLPISGTILAIRPRRIEMPKFVFDAGAAIVSFLYPFLFLTVETASAQWGRRGGYGNTRCFISRHKTQFAWWKCHSFTELDIFFFNSSGTQLFGRNLAQPPPHPHPTPSNWIAGTCIRSI